MTTPYTVHTGDCRDVLRDYPADHFDSIVSDPPYGLTFMGKGWDRGVPGAEFWQEAFRVAKPGAHLLAFGGTRTFHRLTVAIEDAGWEIRDCMMWLYGSGFPKSHDVSKAIDKRGGAERQVLDERPAYGIGITGATFKGHAEGATAKTTAPATDAARQWQGWGTALKPAWEPVIVARKPLSGTVADNVLRYGTGALNIDGCRVGGTEGRWPANVMHDGSAEVVAGFPDTAAAQASMQSRIGFVFSARAWSGLGCPRFEGRGASRVSPILQPSSRSLNLSAPLPPRGFLQISPLHSQTGSGAQRAQTIF